jgi:hypothetical protein
MGKNMLQILQLEILNYNRVYNLKSYDNEVFSAMYFSRKGKGKNANI